jgi:signal transduction histidine kinase
MTERDEQNAGNVSAAEMNALIADYEAKMDEVAELITRVRHEINNPLTGVLGQAQLLLREDLSERARKRAETIEELAVRLRDIVAQLRQVQRPAKHPTFESRPFEAKHKREWRDKK